MKSRPPTVFISYTWESMHHVRWVERLAYDLALSGANVTLDRWNVAPGEQIASFMTSAVKRHDFVLVVCTAKYKRKADGGVGGVAYETDQMTAELAAKRNHKKFIPILASGTWKTSAPTWASGKMFVDMRDASEYREGLAQLRRAVFSEVPAIGPLVQTRITSTVDQQLKATRTSGVASEREPFGGDYILPEVVETQVLDLLQSTEAKPEACFSVLYCDIDGLLAINHKHGFEVGDAVMEKISYLFSFHFRAHEVYRLINRHQRRGGDQIVCIVHSRPELKKAGSDAITVAKECISSIESFDWSGVAPNLFVTVTASIFSEPFDRTVGAPIRVLIGDLIETLTSSKKANRSGLQLLDVQLSARAYRELKSEQARRESEARANCWHGS